MLLGVAASQSHIRSNIDWLLSHGRDKSSLIIFDVLSSGGAGPLWRHTQIQGIPKPANISSCICAMERKPIVAPPAPYTAKGPKPKQAQQAVGRMEFGCFEFNRCASWTRMPNEKQMRKPSGPTRACRIHYYCPFRCVTSWSLLEQSASPAHRSKERMLPWLCGNPLRRSTGGSCFRANISNCTRWPI